MVRQVCTHIVEVVIGIAHQHSRPKFQFLFPLAYCMSILFQHSTQKSMILNIDKASFCAITAPEISMSRDNYTGDNRKGHVLTAEAAKVRVYINVNRS